MEKTLKNMSVIELDMYTEGQQQVSDKAEKIIMDAAKIIVDTLENEGIDIESVTGLKSIDIQLYQRANNRQHHIKLSNLSTKLLLKDVYNNKLKWKKWRNTEDGM